MDYTTSHYLRRAKTIVSTIHYGVLASASPQGEPWVSPVRIVHDEVLRFYWFSDKASRHSINTQNRPAALVIFDSTVPEGQGAGVYMAGLVQELDNPADVQLARMLKKGKRDDAAEFLGGAVRRVYRLTPSELWTNEVERNNGQFIRDIRVPLSLAEFRDVMSK